MALVMMIIAGIVGAGAAIGLMYVVTSKTNGDSGDATTALQSEYDLKRGLTSKLRELYATMVDVTTARGVTQDLKGLQESLKAERGRITITQAELETVETRLRELEEIERELEASGLETKEELTILEKKQKELTNKNQGLKRKIDDSSAQWDQLIKELESNSQAAEKVQSAKTELVMTQEKIETLMLQIEQGNEQYFVLKRRYDALDIEYAQLYEKFSEAESMVSSAKDKDQK